MICMTCREDRPVDDFKRVKGRRRSRRCKYCKRAETRRRNLWHRNGRPCKRCGVVKPCPSEITDLDRSTAGICKQCIQEKATQRTTAWSRDKRASDDEWRRRQIAAALRWQKRNPEQVRLNNQRRYERILADSERHERHKEDARMRHRLRMEKAGTPSRPVSAETYVQRYGTGYGRAQTVPVEPLLPILRAAVEEVTETHVADAAGVSVRRLYEALNGGKRISVVNADRLCTYLGVPFGLLYQDAA